MKSIGKVLSIIFHPFIFILISPPLLIYKTTQNLSLSILWTFYTLIFIIAMLVYLYIGVRKKFFTDFDVSKKTERPRLYFFAAFLLILYLVGLLIFHAPRILIFVSFEMLIILMVISFINRYIKASGHVAFVSAFVFTVVLHLL